MTQSIENEGQHDNQATGMVSTAKVNSMHNIRSIRFLRNKYMPKYILKDMQANIYGQQELQHTSVWLYQRGESGGSGPEGEGRDEVHHLDLQREMPGRHPRLSNFMDFFRAVVSHVCHLIQR